MRDISGCIASSTSQTVKFYEEVDFTRQEVLILLFAKYKFLMKQITDFPFHFLPFFLQSTIGVSKENGVLKSNVAVRHLACVCNSIHRFDFFKNLVNKFIVYYVFVVSLMLLSFSSLRTA